ncbi:MAG: haloacid dehalogenase type II [Verrucomicrobia bacterium]|nr:haloacid dehalogenase type II [Verrucomicrobiota bacterium]
MNRRTFLQLATGSLSISLLPRGRAASSGSPKAGQIKAVAFDALTTFDPRNVDRVAEELFPSRGAQFANLWRTRQFEYSWLRVITGRFTDFWSITHDALQFTAAALKLELNDSQEEKLANAYLELQPYSDSVAAFRALHEKGIRLRFLTNFSPNMLQPIVAKAGLAPYIEPHLTTDLAHTYKPDPRAYQLGVDAFGFSKEEILFAAFASWDANGGKSFGYPTFWVNRWDVPADSLGTEPDQTGNTLQSLVEFATAQTS